MGSDFNVRHRFAGCFILVLLTTILSGVAHADTDQADPAVHRQAYEAALANVLTGPDRILDEMVRITDPPLSLDHIGCIPGHEERLDLIMHPAKLL